jgi:2-polyprenyl-6-hydroxyphenyl methylase/3-demethylubiquinone-9 3-methyltransferase
MTKQANSRIAAEVAQFDSIGGQWWDEQGPFRPLHLLNPARITYILAQTGDVAGLNILDVACGGGLVCEPLARLGADVTGIDTSVKAIAAARDHAAAQGLQIDYQCAALEELKSKEKFDVITALEILEHVSDPAAFIESAAQFLKPGGKIIFSTINRTIKSMLIAKIGAEYIANIVPRGTHDWHQFIQPAELAEYVEAAGLMVMDITGLTMNPLRAGAGLFALSKNDVAVNYFLVAKK